MTTHTKEDFDKMVEEGLVDPESSEEPLDGPPEPTDDDVVAEAERNQPKSDSEPPAPETLDGDNIPEELRGKTADEAVAMYQALKDVSKNLADQVNARSQQAPPAPPEPPAEPEPITADDLVDDDAKNFNEKLNKFFEAKTAPLMQTFVQNAAVQNRQQALAQSEVLQKYQGTLDNIIKEHGVTDQQLANPQTWVILESLVGRAHFDEIVQEKAKASKKPEPELTAGVNATPEPESNARLTAEEKAVARGLGIDPKTYAKMKNLTNQG